MSDPAGGPRKRRGAEKQMVPEAEFSSYYGQPVIKETVWGPDIPAYLFLGWLAGASSALAASAQFSGHQQLAQAAKAGAAGAISLSMVALVHDLGRPARFVNMLRVLKVTSPMSIGTWLLSAYTPCALAAAACAATRKLPRAGQAATIMAATLGPAVAAYTSVLLADTAAPAWHDAYRELPYLFTGSAATAAGGLGLLTVTPEYARPAARLAILGSAAELTAEHLLGRRLGPAAEPYRTGKSGALMRAGQILTACGTAGALLGRRNRAISAMSGAALLAGSAVTRFGVFEAGRLSARDPRYTIAPQRERLTQRGKPAAPPGLAAR
jgi:formate-dependent nitrite reductase membrane component NrfD